MSNRAKTYMLITLGEELLLGLTRNGHLTYIGDQLRQRGITLHSNYTISDENQDIDEQFAFCWERSDVLITTGGLGPTVDDRTKEAIQSASPTSCLLYTSPRPRDRQKSRMPSSA